MRLPYRFGKYVLDRKLAQGGMAEIYKARYIGESGFEKQVAVKRILPAWSGNKDFIAMLCDEARALVNLQHQNIVQVFELGRDGNTYFISMEYVDGIDLRRLLNRLGTGSVLPLRFSCFIISEVLKALDISHSRGSGIIHRDISPQNILISFSGEVKVADFGIAKGRHRTFETAVTQVKGKYAYMSPEQAEGRPVDARTDIYSTGVVFYELLTGKRLRYHLNDLATIEEVKRSMLPEDWRIGLGDAPVDIVEKALSKELGDRYQTSAEFLNDLNRYILDRGIATNGMELSAYLKDLFHEDIELTLKGGDTAAYLPPDGERGTKALSEGSMMLPERSMRGLSFKYPVLILCMLFVSLLGSGPHDFYHADITPVDKAKEQRAATLPREATSSISVNARPWGYVYIPGLLSRKEAPVKDIRAVAGEYAVKVYYEPDDEWVTKSVFLSEDSRTTCLADFTGEPQIRCKKSRK